MRSNGKRLLSLLLASLLCVILLPVSARAAVSNVKVSRMSGDFLSGYYVVFEVDGVRLRSDELGPNTNYDLFLRLNTSEKKELMKNYAFGQGWLEAQFGSENVKQMNNWWNDATGWAGAKKVLEDRIAKRDFPRAESAFGGQYQDKAAVTLPEVEHVPTESYGFLPEVREYLDLCREMELTFDIGQTAYNTLKKTKMSQTAAAVTSLSGDLISLIVERALVPGITPGGLSALAPSFSGELLGLIDKMTGASDSVIEKTVGKRLDAATARQVIDECWKIIELNEEYTEQCISHFLTLKGQKAGKYAAAAGAIDTYIQENEAAAKAKEDAARSAAHTGTGGAVQAKDWDELQKLYQAFKKRYDAWYSGVSGEKSTLANKLGEIKAGACFYSGQWPVGPVNPDQPGPLNLDSFYKGWYASTYYDENGERRPSLPTAVSEMPAAFAAAKAEAAKDIADLDAYVPEYEAWAKKVADEYPSWRIQYMSYKAAFQRFNYDLSLPDDSIEWLLISGYQDCGSAPHWATSDYLSVPLSDYREELVTYQKMLDEHESQWIAASSDVVAGVRAIYNQIKSLQDQHEALLPEVVAAKETMAELIADAETDYGRYELNPDIAARFDAFAYDDFEGYRALYDQCGADLQDRWDAYQEAHETWRRGIYELDWLEREVRAVAGVTYGDFGGDHKLVAEAIGGGTLKTYDQMVTERIYTAGHLSDDGSNLAEAGGTDPNAYNLNLDASYFKHHYEEFTGLNNATAEAGLFFGDIGGWKGKFMRADEATRSSLEYSIKQEIHSYIQHGDYATLAFPYTSGQYYPVSPLGGQRVSSILNGWRSQSDSYKPVTGLSSGRLMAEGFDLTLLPGERYDLGRYVTVEPADATDKALVWETTNDMICEVSENGVLTGNLSGEVTVTVRALDSDFSFGDGGVKIYSPEPLSFTVRVGTGEQPDGVEENAYASVSVYDGAPYTAVDNGDGTTTVSLGLGMIDESCDIVVGLYSADGRLYGVNVVQPQSDFSKTPVAFTAPNGDGLVLKAFVLDQSDMTPLDAPMMEETVA